MASDLKNYISWILYNIYLEIEKTMPLGKPAELRMARGHIFMGPFYEWVVCDIDPWRSKHRPV
jgi:hypothetical protein